MNEVVSQTNLLFFTDVQAKEYYFQTLVETVGDLIQVVTAEGKVAYSNRSLEALTGYSQEEIASLEPFHWIHPDDRERVIAEFGKHLKENFSRYQTQYRIITKSGEVKYLETEVTNALNDPEVRGIIAIIRDISRRVYTEDRVSYQRRLYQLLMEISKQFLHGDIQPAIEEMLTKIGRFAQVDRSYVYLLDVNRTHWDCLFEWRNDEVDRIPSYYYQTGVSVAETPWMMEQFAANRIVNFEYIDDMPPEAWRCKALFKADSTISILLIPMLANDKVLGFIGYDSVLQPKKWQEDDVAALKICTEILTSALIRSNAEIAIKQSLSINKAIIESTAEGILVTDMNDNIITCNRTFQDMWLIPDGILPAGKASIAFRFALQNIENAAATNELISKAQQYGDEHILLTAHLKDKRIVECISKPQVIEGNIVGRVWSCRDITARTLAEREEIEKDIAQARFESLKNQVNPHFLFNSLNVLASLVHIDADLSEKFIDQLARSYRYLLEQKDKELVSLQTEIDFVHAFAFLLKIRFEEKLQIKINLDAGVMDFYIAPLTLQLLIENAVKHNIVSAETPLVIEIFNEDDQFLVVRNNIQPRENQMPSTGVGLKNIRSRYKLFSSREPLFLKEKACYIAKIPLIESLPA